MSFRKLKYKHVNATRSSEVLKSGEVAVDGTSLYVGDGVTAGGTQVGGSSAKITTITTNIQVSGTVWGDGPTVGITDDATTEVIEVTNTSGGIGRVTLPNVTTIGKTVYFKPMDNPAVYVDFVNKQGSNYSFQNAGVKNGGNTIPQFVWLGAWVYYTGS